MYKYKIMGKIKFVILEISFLFLFIFIITCHSFAQTDSLVVGKEYKLNMNYGYELTGILKSFSEDTIKIESESTTYRLQRKDIISIISVEKEKKEFEIKQLDLTKTFSDPNDTRFFLGPSGKTLKQGEFYVSLAGFFPWLTLPMAFPFGAAGITDYINLGVGASPYPTLFYIAPKFRTLHLDNINLSLGFAYAQAFKFEGVNNDYNIGFIYGVSSFDVAKYYTASVGLGMFYNIDWHHKNQIYIYGLPHLLLGFEAQTEKNFKFISENWIDLSSERGANFSVVSAGGRILGEHFAFDLSLLGVITNSTVDGSGGKIYVIPMPWVSFAYNFSLKNF